MVYFLFFGSPNYISRHRVKRESESQENGRHVNAKRGNSKNGKKTHHGLNAYAHWRYFRIWLAITPISFFCVISNLFGSFLFHMIHPQGSPFPLHNEVERLTIAYGDNKYFHSEIRLDATLWIECRSASLKFPNAVIYVLLLNVLQRWDIATDYAVMFTCVTKTHTYATPTPAPNENMLALSLALFSLSCENSVQHTHTHTVRKHAQAYIVHT